MTDGWLAEPPAKSRMMLLNFSGGVDSTFVLWKLLEDGYKLLVHHCRIANREGRVDAEWRAVLAVTDWLREQRLTRFELITSGYDHGTLGRLPFDVEVIGFFTGIILRDVDHRHIDTVVVSSNRDDVSVTEPTSVRVVRRRKLAHMMAARPLNWWVPFAHLSKADMVAQMPPDLLQRTWWCRFPRKGGSASCGVCRPCRDVGTLRFAEAKEA